MSKKVAMRRRLLLGGAVIGVAGLLAAVGSMAFADATLPDDFSDGNANGWSKSGGTWSVVSDGSNKVYQQSKVASELARAFAGDTDATDYAVQARVKPTAYSSPAGFVGVAARAAGATSLYRLVVINGAKVELHAVKSGAVTVLSSVGVPVATGAWHTLRLEVSGGVLRGSVDGTAVVSGSSTLLAAGRVGLTTGYATAAFDDVKLSPAGALPSPSPTAAPTSASPSPSATPTKTATASASPTKSATASATPTATPGAGGSTALPAWPAPKGEVKVSATTAVSGTFDGGLKRYFGIGDGGQSESQDPMFKLADGAVLQNVIIGAPAGDGVHCSGSCTLRNVWWEDVGEDAATFRGGASAVFLVDGGGARSATDKTFQHNGGGTVTIRNFQVENFGKLYRSCGNCSRQYKRTVIVQNVQATAPGGTLVGINTNFGDTATLSAITIVGDSGRKISICDRFTGNSSGDEPTKTGSGADGTLCRFTSSDITYR